MGFKGVQRASRLKSEAYIPTHFVRCASQDIENMTNLSHYFYPSPEELEFLKAEDLSQPLPYLVMGFRQNPRVTSKEASPAMTGKLFLVPRGSRG